MDEHLKSFYVVYFLCLRSLVSKLIYINEVCILKLEAKPVDTISSLLLVEWTTGLLSKS